MRNAVVILPSFNEAENIAPLIKKIEEINKKLVNWDINILVVDS